MNHAPADSKPLPDLDDPQAGPFWRAAQDDRLVAQRCDACNAWRWAPAPICPECLTPGGSWQPLSGLGRVWSFAVYRRSFSPQFAADVPYTVALIELDEGIRMLSNLVDEPDHISVDAAVEVCFVEQGDGVKVPKFRTV